MGKKKDAISAMFKPYSEEVRKRYAKRTLPKKAAILERARAKAAVEAAKRGLPAITPTEKELKETGVFGEARIELMRAEETVFREEETKYVHDLASGLGLSVLTKREIKEHEKELKRRAKAERKLRLEKAALRWKLRITKPIPRLPVERKPRPTELIRIKFKQDIPAIVGSDMMVYGAFKKGDVAKLPKANAEVLIKRKVAHKTKLKITRKLRPKPLTIAAPVPKITRKKPKKKPKPKYAKCPYCGRKALLNEHGEISATHLLSKECLDNRKKLRDEAVVLSVVTGVAEKARKKRKPRKRHVARTGVTMKVLRKPMENGKRVFAFPDRIWKVRKPRGRRK